MMKWRKLKTNYRGMDTELASVFGIFLKPYRLCVPKENLIINDIDFRKDTHYRCSFNLIDGCAVIQRCSNGHEGCPEGIVILPSSDFKELFDF